MGYGDVQRLNPGRGRFPTGRDNDKLMTTMDRLPTFAKLAGSEAPSSQIIDQIDDFKLSIDFH